MEVYYQIYSEKPVFYRASITRAVETIRSERNIDSAEALQELRRSTIDNPIRLETLMYWVEDSE